MVLPVVYFYLTLLLGGTALLLFLFRVGRFLFSQQNSPSGSPDGTMGWPFLGETISFLRSHNSTSLGSFLEDHCKRYGKIFKSHLFGWPTIVSCDLELNNFVLQNEERYFQTSYPKPLHGILGNLALMLVSGDLHKKLRAVQVSLIADLKTRPECLHTMHKLSISALDSWSQRREFRFFPEVKKFTFYMMLKNLLDIEAGDPLASQFLEDFLTFMKGFVSLPLSVPGSAYARAVKARARISSTLKHKIEKQREEGSNNNRRSYADEIFMKRELKDEEKASVYLDILFGGYETTSALLALLVYFLAQEPYALERLKQEHRAVRRRNQHNGQVLSFEDFRQMDFTSHVMNEALRCGNVVKFLHRKALKDVKFKDHVIPAGWQVLPILSGPHLDPSLHVNPSQFNPWRWTTNTTTDDDEAVRSSMRKMSPFGGGARMCPGAELARFEAAIFMHHLVLNYTWRLMDEDDHPVSRPYFDFHRGLLLHLHRTPPDHF